MTDIVDAAEQIGIIVRLEMPEERPSRRITGDFPSLPEIVNL